MFTTRALLSVLTQTLANRIRVRMESNQRL